ncbi:MAG: hypothetical protein KKC75_00950 [Nanoarchaeota archaeon]|nr:hypothetical protein [Nanoarchaeota archaeon]MBU1005049.1 hypothetical protein [Nanoarchaeota archaeon]MBU1946564.1 hypothetical protein [Nanoarchaeota archaeon]
MNPINKNKRYTLNSLETYNLVMNLRKESGLGADKIKECLDRKGIILSAGTIGGWLYGNKKPFDQRIIKQIPASSKELTKEKVYILGTLCGDGYISTGYRIGLGVSDKDFADYFQYCLEKVYDVKCSLKKRIIKPNKFCKNPKPRYIVMQVSKLIVADLNRYSKTFRTKDWRVPKQIIEAPKEIQSYFICGFSDSEGSVRARKRNTEIILCSGNADGLRDIKCMLSNAFGIKSSFSIRKNGVSILTTSDYPSLLKFKEKINFIIQRKKKILEQGLDNYKRKGLKKHSIETKHKAMGLLKQGMKHREIAKLLDINHTSIYDWEKLF